MRVLPFLLERRPPGLSRGHADCSASSEEASIAFATDAGWLQTVGFDCVVCGPGDIAVAHKPNERSEHRGVSRRRPVPRGAHLRAPRARRPPRDRGHRGRADLDRTEIRAGDQRRRGRGRPDRAGRTSPARGDPGPRGPGPPSRLRQRAFPRLPARTPRPGGAVRRRRRLVLELARGDVRAGASSWVRRISSTSRPRPSWRCARPASPRWASSITSTTARPPRTSATTAWC